MKISKEKASTAAIIMLVLAVPLIQTSGAATVDSATREKMLAFLGDVIGLDLTKYNITDGGCGADYPSYYGGIAKEENIGLNLVSDKGNISAMGMFLNGFICAINVDAQPNNSMIFTQQPSNSTLDELKKILQRYQTLAQNYGVHAANVASALSILNNITDSMVDNLTTLTYLNPFNITFRDMKLEIVRYPPTLPSETENHISFTWVYTENGVDMHNKILSITFYGNEVHFSDTWNLFTVACFSVISKDEVAQIAFAAAKNYNLTLIGENDTLIPAKPDWTNMTSTIILNMVPGEIYNDEVNKANPYMSGGNATRDPLALYPLWETVFYFSKSIGNTVGIAVGVWGDTKEIAYITPYGYLGGSGATPTETSTPTEPTPTPPETPTETESSNPPLTIYLISGITAIAITIAVAAIVLKKRSK
jgi:hypothetical protein